MKEYACGKVRYPSRSTARIGQKWLRNTRNRKVEIYHCPDCEGFHLTNRLVMKQMNSRNYRR